ncbi:MAG TPA: ABC transporter substrate-binding protein [Halobacteria archaeon]|jgi:peptide/nickel transport system substrate-binding protein|nr:ABC transporter substrate-binding protein [Halobacteria archaeon]
MIKKAIKTITLLTIIIVIAVSVIPNTVGTKSDNTFRYPLTEDPGSLNPLFSTSADASSVMIGGMGGDGGIFDPLIDVSYESFHNREFIPRIITGWDFKNDESTVVYHLRRDVLWHDNSKLTAHDMKFTYDVITDPSSGCIQYVEDFNVWVKDYRIIDDYTFEVDLRMRDPYHFQSVYYTTGIVLLPYHYFKDVPMDEIGFDARFNQRPIGYGPYKIVDRKVNSYVTLEKFNNYWNKGYPKIDRVIYKVIPEAYPTWVAFKRGEIDLVDRNSLYLKGFNDYVKSGKMTVYDYPSLYFSGFRINFLKEDNPLQDNRIRQAVMYALDRDLLCVVVNENTTAPLETIVTNRYPDRINPNTKRYSYDPSKAKSLLSSAGYKDRNDDGYLDKNGKRLEIKFPYVGGGAQDDVAEWFRAMMKDIGIYADIEQVDSGRWRELADGKGDWDIISVSMTEGPFIADHLDFWFNTNGLGNTCGYSNAELDSLFNNWKTILDPDEQKRILYQIQDVMAEDLPFLYIQQGVIVRGYNSGVCRLKSSPWGMESSLMEYYWI